MLSLKNQTYRRNLFLNTAISTYKGRLILPEITPHLLRLERTALLLYDCFSCFLLLFIEAKMKRKES